MNFRKFRILNRLYLSHQVSVFDRIRRVVKSRHRSLQRYRSHQKIFIEPGDIAPQSWLNFGKFTKSTKILSRFDGFWSKSGGKCAKNQEIIWKTWSSFWSNISSVKKNKYRIFSTVRSAPLTLRFGRRQLYKNYNAENFSDFRFSSKFYVFSMFSNGNHDRKMLKNEIFLRYLNEIFWENLLKKYRKNTSVGYPAIFPLGGWRKGCAHQIPTLTMQIWPYNNSETLFCANTRYFPRRISRICSKNESPNCSMVSTAPKKFILGPLNVYGH